MPTLPHQTDHTGDEIDCTSVASPQDSHEALDDSQALIDLCGALIDLVDAFEHPSPTTDERSPLIMAIADSLEDRGAHDAARLVRDTDPDDDIWNNYIGPLLDKLEHDYSLCTAHGEHLSSTEDHAPADCPTA